MLYKQGTGNVLSSADKSNMVISMDRLSKFDLLFIHAGYIDIIKDFRRTHHIHEANALIYNDSFHETIENNKDYYIDSFQFDNERDYIYGASIINNSTPKGWVMIPERIKKFTDLPVFDDDRYIPYITEKLCKI